MFSPIITVQLPQLAVAELAQHLVETLLFPEMLL
jgi:hypothetical protein